jgi:hypothetical protein
MNIDRLFPLITAIVIAFAGTGRLDILQMWIRCAQVRVLQEARSSAWGSPQIWQTNKPREMKKKNGTKANPSKGHLNLEPNESYLNRKQNGESPIQFSH